MGRTLKINKWLGLAMLSVGVAVVQLSGVNKAKEQAETGAGDPSEVAKRATGFLVILFAAALSSMAGVRVWDRCWCRCSEGRTNSLLRLGTMNRFTSRRS